jgi:hypothetical protein
MATNDSGVYYMDVCIGVWGRRLGHAKAYIGYSRPAFRGVLAYRDGRAKGYCVSFHPKAGVYCMTSIRLALYNARQVRRLPLGITHPYKPWKQLT